MLLFGAHRAVQGTVPDRSVHGLKSSLAQPWPNIKPGLAMATYQARLGHGHISSQAQPWPYKHAAMQSHLPPTICPPSATHHLPPTVHPPSATHHLPPTICHHLPPSATHCPPSTTHHLPPTVHPTTHTQNPSHPLLIGLQLRSQGRVPDGSKGPQRLHQLARGQQRQGCLQALDGSGGKSRGQLHAQPARLRAHAHTDTKVAVKLGHMAGAGVHSVACWCHGRVNRHICCG